MNIEPFIQHLKSNPDASEETVKAYRSDLQIFAEFIRSRKIRLSQVNQAVVHEFIQVPRAQTSGRPERSALSRATQHRRLVAIRRFFAFVRATSNPKLRDPTYGMRIGRHSDPECKAVDEATISTLMAGIDVERDRVLVVLFLASGLRLSELHQLDRDSIQVESHVGRDGQEHFIGTGEVIGKRKKKRRFFVDGDTVEQLVNYLANRNDDYVPLFLSERKQRLSKRAIQHALAVWCRKLRITRIHVHQFRHQYAVRLANAGIDSMVLKTLMGHEDLRTTNGYFRLFDQTIARQYHAAMEVLRPTRATEE